VAVEVVVVVVVW